MPSPRRPVPRFVLAAFAVLVAGCASGSALDDIQSSSAGDGGGQSGEGGSSSDGGANGDGGGRTGSTSPSSGPVGSTSGSTSTTTGSSTSTGVSASSSSSTSNSSSAATTTAASTASATASSSSGGAPICDPLVPQPVCGAGQHCLPEPAGAEASCAPAGGTPVYGGCTDNVECEPITECIDVGDPFALPCCLQYCAGDADCGDLGSCEYFDPPLFADGVEHGVCYDGGPGCF